MLPIIRSITDHSHSNLDLGEKPKKQERQVDICTALNEGVFDEFLSEKQIDTPQHELYNEFSSQEYKSYGESKDLSILDEVN